MSGGRQEVESHLPFEPNSRFDRNGVNASTGDANGPPIQLRSTPSLQHSVNADQTTFSGRFDIARNCWRRDQRVSVV